MQPLKVLSREGNSVSKPTNSLEIVDFWRAMPLDDPPFVHPVDIPVMRRYAADLLTLPASNFHQFIMSQRFGDHSDHRFHFSLLPIPYQGDLNRADIFILQLNPGFNVNDYHAEWNVPAFRRRVERNIRQELDGTDFPFYSLDPELCWCSGYRWWERKFRDIAAIIAHRKYKGRYLDALRELSQRVAVVELVPYHSIAFKDRRLIRVLPSTAHATNLVHSNLLERATSGEALIIAMRKVAAWGVGETQRPGVVLYPKGLARGSSLSSQSIGGSAILERLGIEPPFERQIA
jgi:hypothetical protein